ncbi:MAG: efflux RND transporter permease subunit [Vicinamibacterales bacterium]
MVLGSIQACLVVFAFVRDWRATVIAGIAIPTSVISTFGLMLPARASWNGGLGYAAATAMASMRVFITRGYTRCPVEGFTWWSSQPDSQPPSRRRRTITNSRVGDAAATLQQTMRHSTITRSFQWQLAK